MPLEPDDLLDAPRGRSLLAELIGGWSLPGWWASRPDQPGSASIWDVPAPPPRSELVAEVARAAHELSGRASDPALVVDALRMTVSANMPWQPPDGDDVLLAEPLIAAALRPVAEAVLASPSAAAWGHPLTIGQQRLTLNPGWADEPPVPFDRDVTADLKNLAAWSNAWREQTSANERAALEASRADPTLEVSGTWWSTPSGWLGHTDAHPDRAPMTTRPLDVGGVLLGASEMLWQEDHGGWRSAVLVPVTPRLAPRVFEVSGPVAWAELVRRFPLEVTASRRGDWRHHTGHAGRWAVPDWSAVREAFDAVHVTVAGYLTTAGRAIEVDDDVATVLAGWSPDATAWLTDVLVEDGPRERWERHDTLEADIDQGWRRVPDQPTV